MGVRPRRSGAIHHSDRTAAAARRLRKQPTFAEKKLWKALRETDWRFRKQAPFGDYVVDFVSHRHRLVIEVDGGVHDLRNVAIRDGARDLWLENRGYAVLRFANEQVVSDIDAVLQMISARVSFDTPTPNPSPQGGGGSME